MGEQDLLTRVLLRLPHYWGRGELFPARQRNARQFALEVFLVPLPVLRRVQQAVDIVKDVLLGQVGFENALLVLIQDGAAGVFKDRIAQVVAEFDLAAYLGVQVVFGIFGLPVAAWNAEIV